MMRLGFGARLALIVSFSLIAIQLLAVMAFFLQRGRNTDSGFRLPLPDQVAAMVELVESAAPHQRTALLRALNSPNLAVWLAEREPPAPPPEIWRQAEFVEDVLESYLEALGGREVKVLVETHLGPMEKQRHLNFLSPAAAEIRVRLKTGQTLVINTTGVLAINIFGFPPGFWAGVIGFLIALFTVFMVRREAKPLRKLVDAVDAMQLPEKTQPIPDAPKSPREIRALIAAFNRLRERIARLLTARLALIGGVSHDLRTYATRLRLRSEKIADEEERAKAIRDIDDMIALLDNALLALRDGSAPKIEELFDLAEILNREAEDRRAQGEAVALSLDWGAGPRFVLGDPIALRRLIANIADNAIAYGRAARISARAAGGTATIDIDDDGPGVPPEMREQIMEPFVRLEGSRNRRTGGAGLGLAIAKTIAEAHGGAIGIGDAPGGGARFSIILPLFMAQTPNGSGPA